MFLNNKLPNHPFCSSMHNKMLTLVDFELSVGHILAFIIQFLLLLHLFYRVPQQYCLVVKTKIKAKREEVLACHSSGGWKKKRSSKLLRNCFKHLFANAKFTVQDFSTWFFNKKLQIRGRFPEQWSVHVTFYRTQSNSSAIHTGIEG